MWTQEQLAVKFWRRVEFGHSCWNWTGAKRGGGYGKVLHDGVAIPSNRVAWMLLRGKIPTGMLVCHSCDNPGCVNPAHLFLGTHKDNAEDRAAKGRGSSPSGEKNGGSKLTWADIPLINHLLKNGVRKPVIAEAFGVDASTIYKIASGRRWRTEV